MQAEVVAEDGVQASGTRRQSGLMVQVVVKLQGIARESTFVEYNKKAMEFMKCKLDKHVEEASKSQEIIRSNILEFSYIL